MDHHRKKFIPSAVTELRVRSEKLSLERTIDKNIRIDANR